MPLKPLAPLKLDHERPLPPDPIPPKPPEIYNNDESKIFDRQNYIQKPVPHSPIISPSSIPNPNPSISTQRLMEPGYQNFGGFLYSIPGYSAFHPVAYPGIVPDGEQRQSPIHSEVPVTEHGSFPHVSAPKDTASAPKERDPSPQEMLSGPKDVIRTPKEIEEKSENKIDSYMITEQLKQQTDFEEHFTPKIIPATSVPVSEPNPETVSVHEPGPDPIKVPAQDLSTNKKNTESNLSITSLSQGSGATVTIPSQISNKDMKKRPIERFSLKTSIPISKIDMKCVSNPPDALYQNAISKKPFNTTSTKDTSRIEIQSNILIKSASIESENKELKPITTLPLTSTEVTVAEPISRTDLEFRSAEHKIETTTELKDVAQKPIFNPINIETSKLILKKPRVTQNLNFNKLQEANKIYLKKSHEANKINFYKSIETSDINKSQESNKANFYKPLETGIINFTKPQDTNKMNLNKPLETSIANLNKPPENTITLFNKPQEISQINFTNPQGTNNILYNKSQEASKINLNKSQEPNTNDHHNQIAPNKNNTNSKMLVTIQQSNPQVLLQRTNFETKNLQVPSRLSNQNKKCKEEILTDGVSSKVVALKKLHQENCDENDFENLITENQIYGNKIVVKEKSQGTLQEQDIKNKKNTTEKFTTVETKSVVLQPNFVYLSNGQIAPNLKMVNNKLKIPQTSDCNVTKPSLNETNTISNNEANVVNKSFKSNIIVNQEVLKSGNNFMQSLPNKPKPEPLVIQTNPNLIMNPQFVYQLPIVDANNVINDQELLSLITPNKDVLKPFETTKTFEKLYITAFPCQTDSKLQPKILITNLKSMEISSLDIYEKKRRMKRMKYLSNRENKDAKVDSTNNKVDNNKKVEKSVEKNDIRNIITPETIKSEIYKEFANSKVSLEDSDSGSDNDEYEEDDLKQYHTIFEHYGTPIIENRKRKEDFLANFNLATFKAYKEKELDLQDKTLQKDSIVSAYASAGQLHTLLKIPQIQEVPELQKNEKSIVANSNMSEETRTSIQKKNMFMLLMELKQVTKEYKEGYEKAWEEVTKEKKRRNTSESATNTNKRQRLSPTSELDSNDQLRLLMEIKKCVNENNNLIKQRLDIVNETNSDSNEASIRTLTEKNFSELTRLSQMADRSVKIFSGQNTRRDLNPGFDSENIQKPTTTIKQPFQNYPQLNIPSIYNIIALKSTAVCPTASTTPATSMDEPQNSAAGVKEMFQQNQDGGKPGETKDASSQIADMWLGIEAVIKSYREFDKDRKKLIVELHKRNTALRVEGAHITRSASRDSDKARALLAERLHLSTEEHAIRASLQRLKNAIEVIRNC